MTTQEIWKAYHLDVKRFILSKVNNEVIADDILQNTFIKIHTKLESLKNEKKVKPWVMTIAYNTAMDYFRKNNTPYSVEDVQLVNEDATEIHSEKDCLYGIIKSLPKKYRDPLFLSDIKGLKQAEVAAQLKLQLPTAKSRIQRARKLIAKGYMDCCDYKVNAKGYLVGEVKDKEDCKICS
ncbi:sigma-70 family RNA polymerase sigma factor [Pontimicrobium sp. IMCC45349]|uniref:sigma-70 family RNA polymerase sigma factor n=1 Tax=Pontimicrobium sp. IMCC45349 TaxID=3391574 RepID=UPI0039A382F8